MKKHLPFTAEKTLVIGYNDANTNESKQITVSTLPKHIQMEIELFDRFRQDYFDAYHVMNKQEMACKAQQALVQQMITEHFTTDKTDNTVESQDK